MPIISIIVPVYKAEKYIESCVSAIMKQSFTAFELLLVDDGSPDQSGAICDRLAQTDYRIRVIHKENGGASSARNCGLNEAHGMYVMFCDSDDRPHMDWCREMVAAIERGGSDLCVCGYACVKNDQTIWETAFSSENGQPLDIDIWYLFEHRLLNSPWNKIYCRNVIERNKLRFDATMIDGEDQYFNMQYLQLTDHPICVVPKVLYYYSMDNDASVTTRFIPQMWQQKKKAYALLHTLLFEKRAGDTELEAVFYGYYIDAIIRVLNNNMSPQNTCNVFEKIRMNNRILNDPVCRTALQKGKCMTVSPKYLRLMKLRSYWPLYLLSKLL